MNDRKAKVNRSRFGPLAMERIQKEDMKAKLERLRLRDPSAHEYMQQDDQIDEANTDQHRKLVEQMQEQGTIHKEGTKASAQPPPESSEDDEEETLTRKGNSQSAARRLRRMRDNSVARHGRQARRVRIEELRQTIVDSGASASVVPEQPPLSHLNKDNMTQQRTFQRAEPRPTQEDQSAEQDDPMKGPDNQKKNDEIEAVPDDAMSEATNLDDDALFTRCITSAKVKIVRYDKARDSIHPDDPARMFPTLGPKELRAIRAIAVKPEFTGATDELKLPLPDNGDIGLWIDRNNEGWNWIEAIDPNKKGMIWIMRDEGIQIDEYDPKKTTDLATIDMRYNIYIWMMWYRKHSMILSPPSPQQDTQKT